MSIDPPKTWYRVVGVRENQTITTFAHQLSREQAESIVKALAVEAEFVRIEARPENDAPSEDF